MTEAGDFFAAVVRLGDEHIDGDRRQCARWVVEFDGAGDHRVIVRRAPQDLAEADANDNERERDALRRSSTLCEHRLLGDGFTYAR